MITSAATQEAKDRRSTKPWRAVWVLRPVAVASLLWAASGCAPPTLQVRAVRYDVDVQLDPETHELTGRSMLALERLVRGKAAPPSGVLELALHANLAVDHVEVAGATLRSHTEELATGDENDTAEVPGHEDLPRMQPKVHRLLLEHPTDSMQVTLDYHGPLHQDVEAGEKRGEIHNFAMSAHVGTDGIYLDEGGYWYPVIEQPEAADPELSLSDYNLSVETIEGFELVAGLERVPTDEREGRLRWRSAFPVTGMVLLGGPLKRWSAQHGNVTLHAVLDPTKEDVAADVLAASVECLDRYEPLIGPYPYKEFTLLEAFFSSGFAFPTCTQIVGSQISLYKQYRRHGYLDHELLHNWWGNGLYVDPRDGNWCEALASFAGNYYGYVLDGDEAGARKERRNQSNFLSTIASKDDKPLGRYGLKDGPGRGIAYSKGAAVFHMLERKIGAEAFFAGLRLLTAERMGKFTDWDDLREAFERTSGKDLKPFFNQWVRHGGAPTLALAGADWAPGSSELAVWISQGGGDFDLDVPLRLFYGERTVDVVASVDEPEDRVTVPCESTGLTVVELDPDYHLFRKLKPAEVMPTSNTSKRGPKLVIIVPTGDLPEEYQQVVDDFSADVLGDENHPKKGHEVVVRAADVVTPQDLSGSSVLVIGDAVRAPTVQGLLARTTNPVSWTESGFALEGQEYADPGQAVFFTVHHPEEVEGGVTVYYGNSTAALANAGLLSYYANSLLVFETPVATANEASAADGTHGGGSGAQPHTEVIRRMDFESHDRIEF